MQDRPTAPELLDAMAAKLFAEVREWVPRERRFQVLVLANLCAVVARELRAGPEPALADVRLFRELLRRPSSDPAGSGREAKQPAGDIPAHEADDAARATAFELSAAIRAGDLDDHLNDAITGLRQHTARKLAIARPGYTAPPPPSDT